MKTEPAISIAAPAADTVHSADNPVITALPGPKGQSCNESKVFARLNDQIAWYDNKSTRCQRRFKWIKITEMVIASMIPLLAGFSTAGLGTNGNSKYYAWVYAYAPIATGVLGLLIVIAQSLQNLNQYQHNWITFRSTCEELKHEKYLYEANAAHYQNATDPCRLLAEKVESLVSREHARWQSALQTTITAIRPQQNPG